MNVYIKEIRLKNFQSWRDERIHLAEGFNVIRSDDNSAGKSVIMKAIKMAVCPNIYSREEKKKMIRFNSEYAESIFIFSDNTVGVVRIFPTRVLYLYNDGTGWIHQEGHPISQIVNKIGALVNYEYDFIANLLDMDQPLLLVQSNNKCNFALIDMITHHKDLNRLIPTFRDKLSDHRNKIIELDYAVRYIEKQYKSLTYTDVEKQEENIHIAEDMLCYSDEFMEAYDLLQSSMSLNKEYKDFDTVDFLLDTGSTFLSLLDLDIKPVKEVPEELDYLIDILSNGASLVNSINKLEEYKDYDMAVEALEIGELLLSADNCIKEELQVISSEFSSYRNSFIEMYNILTGSRKQLLELKAQDVQIGELELKLKNEGANAICPVYGTIIIKDDRCYNMQ